MMPSITESNTLMQEIQRMHPDAEITNVKLFLGSNRYVSPEDVLKEATNAIRQINEGKAKAVESIDG